MLIVGAEYGYRRSFIEHTISWSRTSQIPASVSEKYLGDFSMCQAILALTLWLWLDFN